MEKAVSAKTIDEDIPVEGMAKAESERQLEKTAEIVDEESKVVPMPSEPSKSTSNDATAVTDALAVARRVPDSLVSVTLPPSRPAAPAKTKCRLVILVVVSLADNL
jgi:hypothetical protein